MKNMLSLFAICAIITSLTLPVLAEEDIEGASDYPGLGRMNNFYISNYTKNYDQMTFYLLDSEKIVEGYRTRIDYNIVEGATQPSMFQIVKNYENALKKLNAKMLNNEQGSNYLAAQIKNNAREIWFAVTAYNDGYNYTVEVVEIGDMVQEVTASQMLEALDRDGYIALYINFDTGKSDIKPESESIVKQISELVKQNASLKISIEGHTDNTGDATSNKLLSEKRAKAVFDAVVTLGADANRIVHLGKGQENPIADNRTEEGRTLNRRVEIVKVK